jgi:membrane-associated phospholipid phosphatase
MHRRPRVALGAALVCTIGLAVTWLIARSYPVARFRDATTLEGFTGLNGPRLVPLVDAIAHLADPGPYLLIGSALSLIALLRGRPGVALAVPIVLVGAGATTELLKPLLAHPRPSEWLGPSRIDAASWPSGHATAAMTLALCGVMVVPPALRPTAAALGGAFAVAVSYSILMLGWHFPSDVLGGFLVAAIWTLLAVAAVGAGRSRRQDEEAADRASPASRVAAPLAVVAAGVGAVIGIVLSSPEVVTSYAANRRTFLIGALAIPALAAALAGALIYALSARPGAYSR